LFLRQSAPEPLRRPTTPTHLDTKVSGQIFISYRREGGQAWAGRLYDHLNKRFASKIFMDVDMEPGIDFVEAIEKSVSSCDVLIAVIGKDWVTASEKGGRRRLDNPEDFVRTEIRIALKRGIRVIPVLVEGASMPQADELPDDLKLLARRNALNVSHDRFGSDSERLIKAVERALQSTQVQSHLQPGALPIPTGTPLESTQVESPPSPPIPRDAGEADRWKILEATQTPITTRLNRPLTKEEKDLFSKWDKYIREP
jgi:TIR domain